MSGIDRDRRDAAGRSLRPAELEGRGRYEDEERAAGAGRSPASLADLELCRPVYETLPGWSEDITGCPDLERPAGSRPRLRRFLGKQVGVPVSIVSVGPDRQADDHGSEGPLRSQPTSPKRGRPRVATWIPRTEWAQDTYATRTTTPRRPPKKAWPAWTPGGLSLSNFRATSRSSWTATAGGPSTAGFRGSSATAGASRASARRRGRMPARARTAHALLPFGRELEAPASRAEVPDAAAAALPARSNGPS